MKKTRYEKFKEKVNEMSLEELAETIAEFIETMQGKELNACSLCCPHGVKDTVRCSGNEFCNGMSDKEIIVNYLNGREWKELTNEKNWLQRLYGGSASQ